MIRRCDGPALTAATLYELLRLRAAVFVVEQECAYLDPDGRDLLASTEHRWLADPPDQTEKSDPPDPADTADATNARIAAALRVIDDPDRPGARRIGRVVCHPDVRRRGLAALLVRSVVDEQPEGTTLTLHAQSHLVPWYGGLGFAVDGPEYLEDGIPHTPMQRGAAGRCSTGR